MILETGPASRPRSQAGFTVLEIIIVFALITLASGVIITNFTTFLNFDEQINTEDSLRTAIRSARFQAASERRVTSLSFDGEAGTLVVCGGEIQQWERCPRIQPTGGSEIRTQANTGLLVYAFKTFFISGPKHCLVSVFA